MRGFIHDLRDASCRKKKRRRRKKVEAKARIGGIQSGGVEEITGSAAKYSINVSITRRCTPEVDYGRT